MIKMSLVHTFMWSGLDTEIAKKYYPKKTKVFTEMVFPARTVRVIIQEDPKNRSGIADELVSERKPQMGKQNLFWEKTRLKLND